MAYNRSSMPGAYLGGDNEYARLERALIDARQDLGQKKAEFASAMEMIRKQGGQIGDLNYKLNLVTHRAETAEAGLREVTAHHMAALDELENTRRAYSIAEARLHEAERARDEMSVNYRNLSSGYNRLEKDLNETRQVLLSTERELKNALIERNEARGSLRMSQEAWNHERTNLQSKYNASQTQLHSVQGRLDTTEGRLREALRLNDEAAKSLADKTAYMYEAAKYKEAFGVTKKDVEFFKSQLATTEERLCEIRKERDLARVDADLRDRLSGLTHGVAEKRVGFSPHVQVADLGVERPPTPLTLSRTRTCSRRSSISYSLSNMAI